MLDELKLSLKNLFAGKKSALFTASVVALAIYLVLTFSLMQNCALDTERLSGENNPEYKKIFVSCREGTINLYKFRQDLGEIPVSKHISSVSLERAKHDDGGSLSFNTEAYELADVLEGFHLGSYSIQQPEETLETVFKGFNAYSAVNLEMLKTRDPKAEEFPLGRMLDNSSLEFEVIIDNITAKRFGGKEGKDWLQEKVTFTTKTVTIEANIVGLYNYYLYCPKKITETGELEDWSSFEDFMFSEEELNSLEFPYSEINGPIFMNESLRKEIAMAGKTAPGDQFPFFSAFQGRILLTVQDIRHLEQVSDSFTELGYYISSETNNAKSAIERMFFFKNIMAFIGFIIATISFLNLVNTMFTIVAEKQKYIGIMRSLGFSKGSVLRIICYESIWIGLFSLIAGFTLAIVTKYLFAGFLASVLAESGVHQYVKIGFTPSVALGVIVLTLFLTLLASLLSARGGVKKSILKNLRQGW